MLKNICIVLFLPLFLSIQDAEGRGPAVIYSMEDLEALDDLKSSGEILKHIYDIRPSQRDTKWQSILNRNIRFFINRVISSQKLSIADYRMIEKITASKYLDNDEIFLIKRAEYLEVFFENCFGQNINKGFNCAEEINLAIKKSPNLELYPEAHSSLGLVLKKHRPSTKLLPFIKTAITRPIGLKICQNPFVIAEILLKLEQIIDDSSTKKEHITKTNDLMGQECLGMIVTEVKTNFTEVASTDLQEKYYKWLKMINRLDETENIKLLSLLFLNGLKPGETLNLAWNSLKELSENFNLRSKVLAELKNYDPVPDNFLKKDALSKKVFLRHLDKNFPEFIDYYTSTCKNYYQGTQYFPKGNPTVHCKEFLNVFKQLKGSDHLKVSTLEQSIKI